MSTSLENWNKAAEQLKEIRVKCEALQRGDQPEITNELDAHDIMELHRTAKGIVERCLTGMGQCITIEPCDERTYFYAKSYARTTACQIAYHYTDSSRKMQEECAAWFDNEQNLPKISVIYV